MHLQVRYKYNGKQPIIAIVNPISNLELLGIIKLSDSDENFPMRLKEIYLNQFAKSDFKSKKADICRWHGKPKLNPTDVLLKTSLL